jgi:tetraacyldisaccharide 4'-kinase
MRGPTPAALLLPLAWLYRALLAARRAAFRLGLLPRYRAPVPVIVVGNFTVGGNGKTPAVIALVQALQARGYMPGVVSRGYGRTSSGNHLVTHESTSAEVGDEPLLIARRTQAPVAVAARRAEAARLLLARHRCDVIVADDGLQHLALERDIEIAVTGAQRDGNGWLLPAGPLREPPRAVDAVLVSSGTVRDGEWPLAQRLGPACRAQAPREQRALAEFAGERCAAVAGIGRPQAFFDALRAAGLRLARTVALPDHTPYRDNPFAALPETAIFVTEKDAIKCAQMDARLWVVPLEAQLPAALVDAIDQRLKALRAAMPRRGQETA